MAESKKTTLYDYHVAKDAKMEDFAGFMMPIVYTSIPEEHKAVREKAGMFDVSHMGEVRVKGKDALAYVDHVFANEITSKDNGKVVYGMMLYENGTIVDDLLVYKVSDTECFLVVNASNTGKDYAWLVANTGNYDVTVENVSDEYSQIALQGPEAEEYMKKIFGLDLSDLAFYTFGNFSILGHEVLLSRTGYTGEDGFEIYGDHIAVLEIWNALDHAGIVPCGLGARDTLRFEASLPLYGHEISDKITPLEAGLKMFVALDKTDFIGKKALDEQMEKGLTRRVVGLELKEMGIPRQGYPVYQDAEEIGYITTGYLSITLNKPIAMVMLKTEYAKKGTEVSVEIRKRMVPAFVRDKKFLQKNYKK